MTAAKALVQGTLQHIATHGPTQAQVDHAAAMLQFSYQCLWESPAALADHLVYLELACAPIDPLTIVSQVTVKDVADVAKLLTKPLVTIIG
jgi:predicted Zn-dependent peptidase